MRQEAQAIVLAAGPGSRMISLVQKKPKCLLPVGIYPMIYFPLYALQQASFKEATVVVSKDNVPEVTKLVEMYGLQLKLDIAPVPTEDFPGTLESLSSISHKIRKDVDEIVFVSSDIITDVQLQPVIDEHIKKGAALTMLTANRDPLYYNASPPGPKTKQNMNNDIICKDKNTNRLLYSVAGGDYDKCITFPSCLIASVKGAITVSTATADSHLYIMKRWLVDFILDKSSPCSGMGSLKVEVIPYIISQQFKTKKEDKENKKDISTAVKKNKYEDLISKYNTSVQEARFHPLSKLDQRVCYVSHYEGLCVRANTLQSYWQLNKQMRHLFERVCPKAQVMQSTGSIAEKAQISEDCIIGQSVTILEKTNITSCVLGNHSRINSKVRISNSLLFDYVSIAEGCVIEDSLICVNIEQPCIIKGCIVADTARIEANKTYSNEQLEASQDFIE